MYCGAPTIEEGFPVVLYFENDKEKNEFIALVLQAQPNLKIHK